MKVFSWEKFDFTKVPKEKFQKSSVFQIREFNFGKSFPLMLGFPVQRFKDVNIFKENKAKSKETYKQK